MTCPRLGSLPPNISLPSQNSEHLLSQVYAGVISLFENKSTKIISTLTSRVIFRLPTEDQVGPAHVTSNVLASNPLGTVRPRAGHHAERTGQAVVIPLGDRHRGPTPYVVARPSQRPHHVHDRVVRDRSNLRLLVDLPTCRTGLVRLAPFSPPREYAILTVAVTAW